MTILDIAPPNAAPPNIALSNAALDDRNRSRVRLDPRLGAGNYLHVAHRVNTARDVPLLYSDHPVHTFDGRQYTELSIAQLKRIVDEYAAWYCAAGITAFDPVAVYLEEGVEYLIHYTAITALGAIPILINGSMDPAVAAAHIMRCGGVGVFTDTAHVDSVQEHLGGSDHIRFIATDDTVDTIDTVDVSLLPPGYPFQHDDGDPVMITHTSGTTGVPKAVVLRHGGFFHGIRNLLHLPIAPGTERVLSSLPSSHNSAIAYAMHAILSGFQLSIVSGRRGGAYVLSKIEEFRAGAVISFPYVYVEMTEADLDAYDLDSVSLWLSSGDASHEPHIRQLVTKGHHYRGEVRVAGSQFVDGLGSSEMGHTLFRIVHTSQTHAFDRCIGIPQSWTEAVALDDDGRYCVPYQVGRLGVRGPSVTAGYWNDSVRTYKSRVNGYWLTGDFVYRDERGSFYHVDRSVDSIPTSAGILYSLQTEERLLAGVSELADCTVIGISVNGHTEPVCLARLHQGMNMQLVDLLAKLNACLVEFDSPLLYGVRLATRNDIPVGVTGKVLKEQLRRTYADAPAFHTLSKTAVHSLQTAEVG